MFAVDSVGGGACREAFFSRRYLNEDDLAALQRHADAKGATPTFLENKVHQPKIEKPETVHHKKQALVTLLGQRQALATLLESRRVQSEPFEPQVLNPKPKTQNPKPKTVIPKTFEIQVLNPKFSTLNPKP
jgi:hypothetical protein